MQATAVLQFLTEFQVLREVGCWFLDPQRILRIPCYLYCIYYQKDQNPLHQPCTGGIAHSIL